MMSKNSPFVKRFGKVLPLVPLLLFVGLMFCDKQSIPDEIYSDVQLHYERPSFSAEKSYKPRPALDISGKPFTGTKTERRKEDNRLFSIEVFEDGLSVERTYFKDDGSQWGKYVSEYENGYKVLNRHFDENNTLRTESIGTLILSDSMIKKSQLREFYADGSLKYEGFFYSTKEHVAVYDGQMTLYDEKGQILEQELYKDGELVEKIK